MDGTNVLSAVRDAAWISRATDTAPAQRPKRFLQRDLSEQALRFPPERLFTKSELAAAGQDAFDAGHAAGLADAATSRAAAGASALSTIADTLADGCTAAGQVADEAADALARTLLIALQAVMPDLIERSALNEAQAMLRHILPGLSREPRVLVEVPEPLVEDIETWLATLAPGQRNMIEVSGQDSLGTGEMRVSWSGGEARRQPASVWQGVMATMQQALGPLIVKDDNNGQ